MTTDRPIDCPDCDGDFEFTRRDFVKTVGAGAVAAGVTPLLTSVATAAPTAKSTGETIVKKFYDSLSDDQKGKVCFPFGHKLQTRLSANWHVTKERIGGGLYTKEQQELIDKIVRAVCSEDGYDRLKIQMKDDMGGFEKFSVAVFGTPGTGKFQWLLTGRHLTLRCDGDSVENMAFGGPIVYGHGVGDPKKNLFHYQTKQTNEVFKSLEGKQRTAALLDKAPRESAVPLQGKAGKFPGISVGELSSDQKQLVEKSLKTILAPYRKEDVEEAMAVLKQGGGLDKLHMAFYKQGDLGKDKVWDVWRVEGPTFVWHFRGAPHVHAYINIGLKKA
jgi:hypothetical protein